MGATQSRPPEVPAELLEDSGVTTQKKMTTGRPSSLNENTGDGDLTLGSIISSPTHDLYTTHKI
jgi:hypothetical protein